METVTAIGPSLADKLTQFRSTFHEIDGTRIELMELSADQMADIWAELDSAEQGGRVMDVYRLLVLHGAHHGGAPVFESIDQVKSIPARYLVPMGEKMIELCDMGLDLGNAASDQAET